MATRKAWDALSPAQRRRYIGAWRSGKATGTAHPGTNAELEAAARRFHAEGDLRRSRGHGPKPPAGAAPKYVRDALARGVTSTRDREALAKWRRGRNVPSWLPKSPADMDDVTAAILSTITPAPNQRDVLGRRNGWRSITFRWSPNPNDPVTITIKPVRGNAFNVELPNRDSALSLLAHMRRNPGTFGGIAVVAPESGSPRQPATRAA